MLSFIGKTRTYRKLVQNKFTPHCHHRQYLNQFPSQHIDLYFHTGHHIYKVLCTLLGDLNVYRDIDVNHIFKLLFLFILFIHFYPGTLTTHAESINSDLQGELDRRLRHIQQNRISKPLKYQRTTNTTATLVVKY